MNINSKTGIKLAKREKDTLTNAMELLMLIQKHGSETQGEDAAEASERISQIFESIEKSTLVGAK